MSLLSLFSIAVFAAETILSPIPDSVSSPVTSFPAKSFAQIIVKHPPTKVLGVMTETPPATPSATPTVASGITTMKKHYSIAFLGDSMIDTLGPGIPHTQKALKSLYPSTSFDLYNYGVGATNIDYGLQRITRGYTYLGNEIPALITKHPDIVVVESFAYNPYPYDAGALDRHWLQLAAIVDSLKANLPGVRIVIAATIAPNSTVFGDGAPGLSFAIDDKIKRTTTIKQYLDSTVKFAKSQKLPLADVFHASIDAAGNGKLQYINGGDHIHYSDAGRMLFAQIVANTLTSSGLIK